MNKLIIFVMVVALCGCGNNLKITTMAEIQKMDSVKEISIQYCGKWKDGNECLKPEYWDSTSNKQRISEFMSVIRKLKIEPNRGPMYGRLICFRDDAGKILCTNMEPENDKTLDGSDYVETTGKLSAALEVAMAGCEDKSKPCPATIDDVKSMDVVEVSLWSFNSLKNGNEFIDLKKLKTTTDKKKIAGIMSAVKEIKTGDDIISPPAPALNLICFRNKDGEILCTSISYYVRGEIYGENYVDTGKLDDALQSAGLVPEWRRQ
jgi:hypothetical protein